MTRRGYDTVMEAVRKFKGWRGRRYAHYGLLTLERVTNRVMMGERIEDAWRNELTQQKENPR